MRLDAGLEHTERILQAQDTAGWGALVARVIADCHPEQRDFTLDPARYIAALVGRGGGKTVGGMARFVVRLLTTPAANCFYLAKYREHAERLMWQPLKRTLRSLGLRDGVDVIYHETKLRLRLVKTGATLQLFGADKPGYIESLRGQSYHEVGIDEGAIHPDDVLAKLVHSIIGPRLLGALWIIGTPGLVLKGLFYEVTRRGSTLSRLWTERDKHPEHRGWSLHRWSLKSAIDATKDRPIPTLVALHAIQLEEIATKGWSDDNPIKRRELDGEWAADDTVNVYQYRIYNDATGELWNRWSPERTGPLQIAKLPAAFTDWVHVVAIDPGFTDPTAINVFAFSPSDPSRTIYHRLCFEQTKMYAQTIAFALIGKDLDHERPDGIFGAIGEWPNGITADPAHQMAQAVLAELSNVYGIHVEPAQKGFKYKIGAIDVVNGDLVEGRIKVLQDSALELQLLDLQWDESRTGERIERKNQPNHSTDCLTYARAMIAQFLVAQSTPYTEIDPRTDPHSPLYEPPMPTATADDYAALLPDGFTSPL